MFGIHPTKNFQRVHCPGWDHVGEFSENQVLLITKKMRAKLLTPDWGHSERKLGVYWVFKQCTYITFSSYMCFMCVFKRSSVEICISMCFFSSITSAIVLILLMQGGHTGFWNMGMWHFNPNGSFQTQMDPKLFNLIPKVIIVTPKTFQRFIFCIWEIFFE